MRKTVDGGMDSSDDEGDAGRELSIRSVSHHLGSNIVVSSVVLQHASFEIRCFYSRSYTAASVQLGLFHVASMYIRRTSSEHDFWKAIARSAELEESLSDDDDEEVKQSKKKELVVNTQHICRFSIARTSKAEKAYLIYQCFARKDDGLVLEIEFLSVIQPPFLLEISIKTNNATNNKFQVRVEPQYLRALVIQSCFPQLGHFVEDSLRADEAEIERDLFQDVTDGLLFDRERNCFILRQVESKKLAEYVEEHISEAASRKIKKLYNESILNKVVRDAVRSTMSDSVVAETADMTIEASKRNTQDMLLLEVPKRRNSLTGRSTSTSINGGSRRRSTLLPTSRRLAQGFSLRGSMIETKKLGMESKARLVKEASARAAGLISTVPDDEVPSFIYLHEIVSMKSSDRSQHSLEVLANFLRSSMLASHVKACSLRDLCKLAASCSLHEVHGGRVTLPKRKQRFDGKAESNAGIFRQMSRSADESEEDEDNCIRGPGDLLGEELLSGALYWNRSVNTWRGEHLHLCVIPAEVVLKWAGFHNKVSLMYLTSFWKFYRLHHLFQDPRSVKQRIASRMSYFSKEMNKAADQIKQTSEFENPSLMSLQEGASIDEPTAEEQSTVTMGLQTNERSTVHNDKSSVNETSTVTHNQTALIRQLTDRLNDSIRVRIFQMGDEIFEQGGERSHFYFVLRGECSYIRTIDGNSENSYLHESNATSAVRVDFDKCTRASRHYDIGLHLFSSDFSFLDGENTAWFLTLEEELMKHRRGESSSDEAVYDESVERVVSKRQKLLYGCHRHTLRAETRVEILTVPLSNIVTCGAVGMSLLEIATKKYYRLYSKNRDLVKENDAVNCWKNERTKFLNDCANLSYLELKKNESALPSKKPPSRPATAQGSLRRLSRKLRPEQESRNDNRENTQDVPLKEATEVIEGPSPSGVKISLVIPRRPLSAAPRSVGII